MWQGGVNLTGMPGSLTSGQITDLWPELHSPRDGTGGGEHNPWPRAHPRRERPRPDTASGSRHLRRSRCDDHADCAGECHAGSTVNVPITLPTTGLDGAGVTYSASLANWFSGVSCTGATCSYNRGRAPVDDHGSGAQLRTGRRRTSPCRILLRRRVRCSQQQTVWYDHNRVQYANNTASGSTTIYHAGRDLVITKIVDNSTAVHWEQCHVYGPSHETTDQVRLQGSL